MSENGRNHLMSQLMKDYDRVMFAQQDPDYELDHLVSIGAV